MDPKDYKPLLNVRIPHDLNDRLERLVEQTGVSRTELVERILALGLSDEEELIAALQNPLLSPLARFATHKAIVKLLAFLAGDEVDETFQKEREHVLRKKRGKGKPEKE